MSDRRGITHRLYFDEDMSHVAAKMLTALGHDVVTVLDAETCGWADVAQMQYAVDHRRIMVTYNTADFVRIFRGWLAKGQCHFGIIACTQTRPRITADRLHSLLGKNPPDFFENLFFQV